MAQNRSTAVMQRRVEAHDSLDDFPTPPWATRAVIEFLQSQGFKFGHSMVREPCANRGYMARPLAEYFAKVHASDVHDYGVGYEVVDYLFGPDDWLGMTDWTFLNPPFRLAAQFIERALRLSRIGVAVIVRSAFVEGAGRFTELFGPKPPAFIVQHVERVPMVKGRYDPTASTATCYTWIIWIKGEDDTRFRWIPPCRKRLERADDVAA